MISPALLPRIDAVVAEEVIFRSIWKLSEHKNSLPNSIREDLSEELLSSQVGQKVDLPLLVEIVNRPTTEKPDTID